MRLTRLAGLMLTAAAAAWAQNGVVQNAASYNSIGFNILPIFALTSQFTSAEFLVGLTGLLTPSPNIVSPRMLAVLSYAPAPSIAIPDPFAPNPTSPKPVNATLFIRPSGTTTDIPVSVENAVAGTVTFVVPAGVPLGGAELLYQIDNGPTQWTPVNVVQSSFAFFRNGLSGQATAQAISPQGFASNVGLASPIQPGQTLLLAGSGLGYGSTVTATIGGVTAPVIYAGASGTQSAGHDEIRIQVPAGVADGCYVPMALTYNKNIVTTTIPVTSNGFACRHPWQLSLNDMKTLDSGGSLATGEITLNSQLSVVTATAGSRNETAYMQVSETDAATLAGYFNPPLFTTGCQVVNSNPAFLAVSAAFAVLGSPGPNPPDIGSPIALTSPTTAISLLNSSPGFGYYDTSALPAPVDGPLTNLPPPAIAGGKWTLQSAGGKDIGAVIFNFALPSPIQLTGGVPVMVDHTQDRTISWNGAGFDAGATVFINLSGNSLVTCIAPASAGTITIPAALLSGFNPNTIGTLTINLSEAGAYLPHAEFQLNNHNSLLMFVSFSSSDSRPVFFQ